MNNGGFFEGVKKGMHLFGQNIANLMNVILLSIVYLLGVGLTSMIAKFAGKRFLDWKRGEGSYWKTLNLKKKKMDEYYRQF
jgi:hypothetical protein